jgi:hypothetical protein
MPPSTGSPMYRTDSRVGSLAASVFETRCSLMHRGSARRTSEPCRCRGVGRPDLGAFRSVAQGCHGPWSHEFSLLRCTITISCRAVVRRTRRLCMSYPDIFHFVDIASTRTSVVFVVKNSQTTSSKTELAWSILRRSPLNSVEDKLFRPWARPSHQAAACGRLGGTRLPEVARLREFGGRLCSEAGMLCLQLLRH